MRILVTGAAGFIGFHLVKKLLAMDFEVVGIDNINNYYDPNLKYSRLEILGINKIAIQDLGLTVFSENSKNPNFTFLKLDIVDRKGMEQLFADFQFDVVVNLAAQAGVRYSIENPHAYVESNVTGFLNILEGCRHNKVKHLVYASSSSIYGLNSKIPFSPEDNVDHPISLYAATKKSNELMAHTYSHLYKIPTTGLRFFTVYGPWGRPDMAYFLFTDAILKNKAIKVFNHGNMERDFTYIDDIVNGIIKVIENPAKSDVNWKGNNPSPSSSKAPYKIYNIGNSKPVKLLDFIEAIEEKLGKKATKKFMPMQDGDVATTFADVSELKTNFNYSPATDLKKGISHFVDWYRKYYVKNFA